ncbi:MAG TPA: PEGA domain-containing protein [Tepidisphaeraceae bacterium]|nr:PEGA domain-containing protein [Tepidisphaeraceae bacterium]
MRHNRANHAKFSVLLALVLAMGGCVQRQLTVTTNPPGALVHLNGQEFGRTPVTRDFTWYGTYDVTLRRDGYETKKTTGKVIAPWWQWVPFDLFAELLPLTDRRTLHYTLQPSTDEAADPQRMLDRAEALRGQLQSTSNTRQPTTAPLMAPPASE